jgi:hypothetical protein
MKFPVKIFIIPKINHNNKKLILCKSGYNYISFYLDNLSPINSIKKLLSNYFIKIDNKNNPFVINKISDNNDSELCLYYDIIGLPYNSINLEKVKEDGLIITDYNIFFEKLIGVNNG